ncbi:M15 family metallopeptidase [Prosthecobacter sp.]|uniref:M15 family metallopeptidase n=1 Tax=Prosthecobacter sp. TaxID=1965333 RepID=UPI002488B249|nr:M15 family metallopeptidase [Prosthecobacter sp.]MDI1311879.1 M15 family metallopeptidase [Prosthecobacter sp.]
MNNDEAARRAYWADQMEQGYAIVQKLIAFPVNECGERFASIPDAAAAANVEMLFSTSKIAGDLDRVYFLRESLVRDVITIGREMNERGWILKIEDGFRSLDMQGQLVRKPSVFDTVLKKCIWELGGETPSTEMMFRRAIVLTANMPKIGAHMSGSAIDISVFRRDDGTEVWRGYPYLEMSECTPMRSPFVAPEHVATRLEIAAMMEKHGFIHFPFEFWHFDKDDAGMHILTGNPAPCRFGPVNWDSRTNEVTPVIDPFALLNPLPVIEKEIVAALERVHTD